MTRPRSGRGAQVLQEIPALLVGSAFLLSLLVGSFLNVVIHRLPIMLDRQWRAQAREMLTAPDSPAPPTEREPAEERYNLIVPRSACPHCGAPILAHQNIPVVSWLLHGGKCATCKAEISPRYPIVELATAVLSAAVVWNFGFHWQSVAALFLTWALVALTVIDLDHQILPDVITLPLLWLGLLASVVAVMNKNILCNEVMNFRDFQVVGLLLVGVFNAGDPVPNRCRFLQDA